MSSFKYIFFWTALLISDTAAQLLIKAGAVGADWRVLAGYAFVVLSFLTWMQILKITRLSLALSATSLNYVTVAIAAHYFFGEPLTPMLLLGCSLIAVGVFILGTAEHEI